MHFFCPCHMYASLFPLRLAPSSTMVYDVGDACLMVLRKKKEAPARMLHLQTSSSFALEGLGPQKTIVHFISSASSSLDQRDRFLVGRSSGGISIGGGSGTMVAGDGGSGAGGAAISVGGLMATSCTGNGAKTTGGPGWRSGGVSTPSVTSCWQR